MYFPLIFSSHTHTHTHTHTHAYLHVDIHIYITYTHTCTYIHTFVCSFIHLSEPQSVFSFLSGKLILSGSSPYATLTQNFIFACIVEYEKNFNVQFLADSSVVGSLQQTNQGCGKIHLNSKTYKIVCGEGTDSSMSDIKHYTLEIIHVTFTEKKVWFCKLKNGSRSNILHLNVHGEIFS